MLAPIRRQAALAVRHHRAEAREEFIQAVVANAYCAWVRLVEQGRPPPFPRRWPGMPFARSAPAAGSAVGKTPDECCRSAQRGCQAAGSSGWTSRIQMAQVYRQLLVEDRRAGPAETAAARLDFRDWLNALSPRMRQIARALALGSRPAAWLSSSV